MTERRLPRYDALVPPPSFVPEVSEIMFTFQILPSSRAWGRVNELLGRSALIQAAGIISGAQARWLAQVPYDRLAPHVREIYEALERVGMRDYIPNDNKERAIREAGWRPK
jgi:hypothetical protein